ncbi:iron-siderophore ABC transporter substrate-binding protein [Szabonella alba]|uniref:Iron-siderophore ABC transporter substrate-binding protein n=1 Tax=Szabonella alba TaxID=2804194 RepID=A0A8K0VBH4_9RHOB|nr:iron-siderophore ABC transporter substrate-binding protein [Szabonella alba]MBL4919027.1 iron-siderophore ABC transporter substrate-binding protein [Szabonella alba]
MVTRRVLLGAAAAAVLGRARPAPGAVLPRIAAIDWAMAETAMALGHPPEAIAELIAFRRVAPARPPAATADLGLRGAPNLEALSLSGPDLILSSSYYSFAEPQLSRIAPVLSQALYVPREPPLPKLVTLVSDLARALGRPEAAVPVLQAAGDRFTDLRARLTPDRPCLLIEIGDARHIRVFGGDSLFGGALQELGLTNAWTGDTRFAFNAPVPMERLAAFPDARFVIIGAVPPQAARSLQTGALWTHLAPVRRGDVHHLPEFNAFGGLPSALRFAGALTAALRRAA